MYNLKWWQKALVYAVFGWAVEVFFTGFFNAVGGDIKAVGQTYLWMLPVWGFGGLLFEEAVVFQKSAKTHFLVRVFVYTLGLVCVEYLSGTVISIFTGVVPWDYSMSTSYHLHGLVRFDYLPFWAACGIVMEQFVFVVRRTFVVRSASLEKK